MDESLTMRRRVDDEGLRVVKSCQELGNARFTQGARLTSAPEEATANFVPAAAVIRRWQALFGITGHKGRVGGHVCRV